MANRWMHYWNYYVEMSACLCVVQKEASCRSPAGNKLCLQFRYVTGWQIYTDPWGFYGCWCSSVYVIIFHSLTQSFPSHVSFTLRYFWCIKNGIANWKTWWRSDGLTVNKDNYSFHVYLSGCGRKSNVLINDVMVICTSEYEIKLGLKNILQKKAIQI